MISPKVKRKGERETESAADGDSNSNSQPTRKTERVGETPATASQLIVTSLPAGDRRGSVAQNAHKKSALKSRQKKKRNTWTVNGQSWVAEVWMYSVIVKAAYSASST